jgi:hypothetical protein
MSRPTREAKSKALKTLKNDEKFDEDEEYKLPPPLHIALGIGVGRGTSATKIPPVPTASVCRGVSPHVTDPCRPGVMTSAALRQRISAIPTSSLGRGWSAPGRQSSHLADLYPPGTLSTASSRNKLEARRQLDATESGDSCGEDEVEADDSDEGLSSESEDSDSETPVAGKDGRQWRRQPSGTNLSGRRGPVSACNVFHQSCGPSLRAKKEILSDQKAMSALSLFISETMLRRIQKFTIAEAIRRTGSDWTLSLGELEAFIGLLYARGLMGAKNIPISELWGEKWGNKIFSKTMTRDRFNEIMRYIRFDDKPSRSQRLNQDKFALFSEIWNMFNENCQLHYTPEENLSVDEQLFPTKSRCRFTQFMGNKPDKMGIKIWVLAEVVSKYFLCGIPYLGKDEARTGPTLAHSVVFQLMDGYLDKGYNVTADNFFTQLPLVLALKERNTTYIGTLRSNRREVPLESLDTTRKPLYGTEFFVEDNGVLLTSYKAKKNKNVLLLSSRHEVGLVTEHHAKKKPNTVLFYNDTKYGVDAMDQMCKGYSVKSGVRRWPLALFFNLLDLAAINAYVLYQKVTLKSISRRVYMKMLVEELTAGSTERPAPLEQLSTNLDKRRQCAGCRNKTFDSCAFCKKPVCGNCVAVKHVQNKCRNCVSCA